MKILTILLFMFSAWFGKSQSSFSGEMVDENTNEVLAYVNIGVIGKNIGTVSDINGKFSLRIEEKYNADTVRFSMIGYESLEMIVADFKKKLKNNAVVKLKPSITELTEVVISGKDLKEKVLGNTTRSKNVTGGFSTDLLGNEVGVIMKLKKKRPTYIKDFNCFIAKNRYGKIKFRLNIYELEKGMPGRNILTENIFVETEIEQGVLSVDLTKYNIWVEKDFLVSLEWIEDLGEGGLYFSARLLGAPMIARQASQGHWGKITMASLGFNCTVRY